MTTLYVIYFWFDSQVNMVSDDSHKCEECYTNWSVCNSSLASTRLVHIDGSNSKYTKVENEWHLKSVWIPALVDHTRQCQPYKYSKGSWRNDKKLNTIISANVVGKEKKQTTANQKQQPSPISMLWLVRCMVSIQDCFQLWILDPG